MNARSVMWEPGMTRLPPAVVAIGVFDGVHAGHQELLADTVRDARRRGVQAIAVTFDRDPDQVVSPSTAAPQLLTLDDKIDELLACGVVSVLVVPFTPELATTSAEDFLDEVLGDAIEVVAVHVGQNFRFGERAAGDIDTLYVWGVEHNVEIVAHQLVTVRSHPVSSTRIRGLVSMSDVVGAEALLGRPARVRGCVVHGRGEGALLGFPTANVEPLVFSAVPGAGVYAAVAVLPDGARWPAAVSVGAPPSFPQAKEYVEAHLVGFEGDLYEQQIALDFIERIRAHRQFDSAEELTQAIALDVTKVVALVRDHGLGVDTASNHSLEPELAFGPLVEDPVALERAQKIANAADPMDSYGKADTDWVPVVGPVKLSGIMMSAGLGAFAYSSALESAGVSFAWDPYPPDAMPSFRPAYGAADRPFTILVPESQLEQARVALQVVGLVDSEVDAQLGSRSPAAAITPSESREASAPSQYETVVHTDNRQRVVALLFVFVLVGSSVVAAIIAWVVGIFD